MLDHAYLSVKCANRFYGRENMIKKIENYILNKINTPFFIYGESGSGKTSLIAISAYNLLKNVPDPDNYIVILRFFGTTRRSSSITNSLESICLQLDSLFDIEFDKSRIKNLNDLKDYLLSRLHQIKEKHANKKIVFFLDSIDQLNSNDYDLSWMIRDLPSNTKMIYSTLSNHGGILDHIRSLGFDENDNYLFVEKLNLQTSMSILEEWLKKENSTLKSNQIEIVNNLFEKAVLYPLYVKLIFDIVSKWTSYYIPNDDFFQCTHIDNCIKYLFKILEDKHGSVLFSRICLYLTLFNNGISENELEDILSIDDDVLFNVLAYHSPPTRRFPFYLWVLIKNDISEYLTIKESDDTQVVTWFHRRFFEVVNSLYKDKLKAEELDAIILNVIDYYVETWNKKPKPFIYTEYVRKKLGLDSPNSEAFRFTKQQKIENTSSDGNKNYNKRKLNEFPKFIISLNNIDLKIEFLANHIYFDYNFMHAKALFNDIDSLCKQNGSKLWSIFNNASNYEKKIELIQILIMNFFYENNRILLQKYSTGFTFLLFSKLLKLINNDNLISKYLKDCLEKSMKSCALVLTKSFLPIVDKTNSTTMMFAYRYFQTISNIYGTNLILASTNSIYVINTKQNKVIDSLMAKGFNYQFALIRYYAVYFEDIIASSEGFKLNELNGGCLIRQSNRIYSFSFDQKILFSKKYDSTIDFHLISTKHLVLHVKESNSIEILNVKSGKLIIDKHFSSNIVSVNVNLSKQQVYLKIFEQLNVFISVTLNTGDINIFSFNRETEKLNLVAALPCNGLKLLASESDEYYHPQNVLDRKASQEENENLNNDNILARFVYCFNNLNIFILNIKHDSNTKHSFSTSLVQLKFDLTKNKIYNEMAFSNNLVIEDFFNNKLLLKRKNETYSFLYDFGIYLCFVLL